MPVSSHIKHFQVEVVHLDFLAQFSYMLIYFYYHVALR